MITHMEATFANGVLKPDTPLTLAEQTRVRLTVEPVEELSLEKRRAALEEFLAWAKDNRIKLSDQRYTRDELHERD